MSSNLDQKIIDVLNEHMVAGSISLGLMRKFIQRLDH